MSLAAQLVAHHDRPVVDELLLGVKNAGDVQAQHVLDKVQRIPALAFKADKEGGRHRQ